MRMRVRDGEKMKRRRGREGKRIGREEGKSQGRRTCKKILIFFLLLLPWGFFFTYKGFLWVFW